MYIYCNWMGMLVRLTLLLLRESVVSCEKWKQAERERERVESSHCSTTCKFPGKAFKTFWVQAIWRLRFLLAAVVLTPTNHITCVLTCSFLPLPMSLEQEVENWSERRVYHVSERTCFLTTTRVKNRCAVKAVGPNFEQDSKDLSHCTCHKGFINS